MKREAVFCSCFQQQGRIKIKIIVMKIKAEVLHFCQHLGALQAKLNKPRVTSKSGEENHFQ